MTPSILFLIALALLFDFLNGFHDSANSIATIVSTRVLSPRLAVIWAAFFNFLAFLFFGLHVATTIGKGIIDIAIVDQAVIFGALMGACGWNIITWYFGLPTSSSHALIGGMIGAALVKNGVLDFQEALKHTHDNNNFRALVAAGASAPAAQAGPPMGFPGAGPQASVNKR